MLPGAAAPSQALHMLLAKPWSLGLRRLSCFSRQELRWGQCRKTPTVGGSSCLLTADDDPLLTEGSGIGKWLQSRNCNSIRSLLRPTLVCGGRPDLKSGDQFRRYKHETALVLQWNQERLNIGKIQNEDQGVVPPEDRSLQTLLIYSRIEWAPREDCLTGLRYLGNRPHGPHQCSSTHPMAHHGLQTGNPSETFLESTRIPRDAVGEEDMRKCEVVSTTCWCSCSVK